MVYSVLICCLSPLLSFKSFTTFSVFHKCLSATKIRISKLLEALVSARKAEFVKGWVYPHIFPLEAPSGEGSVVERLYEAAGSLVEYEELVLEDGGAEAVGADGVGEWGVSLPQDAIRGGVEP